MGSSDRKASKEGYTKENYYVCTLADNHEITHILHITLFLTYNVNIKCRNTTNGIFYGSVVTLWVRTHPEE